MDNLNQTFQLGRGSRLMEILLWLSLMGLFIAVYHIVIATPQIQTIQSSTRAYYVADLGALSDAKIVAMLRGYEAAGTNPDEAVLSREIVGFQKKLADDFVELSNGYPVFQRGTVIVGDVDLRDLTTEVAQRNGLDLKDSLDTYLKTKVAP